MGKRKTCGNWIWDYVVFLYWKCLFYLELRMLEIEFIDGTSEVIEVVNECAFYIADFQLFFIATVDGNVIYNRDFVKSIKSIDFDD